jgi:hypothetical protein
VGSIHRKIEAHGDLTIYRRVDDGVIDFSVDDVGDEGAYIIVDHRTRKAACGSTEEQARRNLWRIRLGAERRFPSRAAGS